MIFTIEWRDGKRETVNITVNVYPPHCIERAVFNPVDIANPKPESQGKVVVFQRCFDGIYREQKTGGPVQ